MRIIKAVEFIIITLFLLSCGLALLFWFIGNYIGRIRVKHGSNTAKIQPWN